MDKVISISLTYNFTAKDKRSFEKKVVCKYVRVANHCLHQYLPKTMKTQFP